MHLYQFHYTILYTCLITKQLRQATSTTILAAGGQKIALDDLINLHPKTAKITILSTKKLT